MKMRVKIKVMSDSTWTILNVGDIVEIEHYNLYDKTFKIKVGQHRKELFTSDQVRDLLEPISTVERLIDEI
jgi:hypothetical protein